MAEYIGIANVATEWTEKDFQGKHWTEIEKSSVWGIYALDNPDQENSLPKQENGNVKTFQDKYPAGRYCYF